MYACVWCSWFWRVGVICRVCAAAPPSSTPNGSLISNKRFVSGRHNTFLTHAACSANVTALRRSSPLPVCWCATPLPSRRRRHSSSSGSGALGALQEWRQDQTQQEQQQRLTMTATARSLSSAWATQRWASSGGSRRTADGAQAQCSARAAKGGRRRLLSISCGTIWTAHIRPLIRPQPHTRNKQHAQAQRAVDEPAAGAPRGAGHAARALQPDGRRAAEVCACCEERREAALLPQRDPLLSGLHSSSVLLLYTHLSPLFPPR